MPKKGTKRKKVNGSKGMISNKGPRTIEARTDMFYDDLHYTLDNNGQIKTIISWRQPEMKLSTHHFVSNYNAAFSKTIRVPSIFYADLDYDRDVSMDDFLRGLKRATNVRLVANCHGYINGLIKPSCKVVRTTLTPNGVCSFWQYYQKIGNNYTDFLEKDMKAADFHKYHTAIMLHRLITACQDYMAGDQSPYTKSRYEPVINCISRTAATELITTKTFSTTDRMFNKTFMSYTGLHFLFVGYSPQNNDTFVYRNLFAQHETVTLQQILSTYFNSSAQVTLMDYSCNNPSPEFVLEGHASDEKFAFDDDGVPNANFYKFGGRTRRRR